MKTRNTEDLLLELQAEASGAGRAVLVVWLDDAVKLVASDDADAQTRLNDLAQKGSCAIGFIRITGSGDELTVSARPLDETAHVPEVRDFLDRFRNHSADFLERELGVYAHRVPHQGGKEVL